MSSTINLILTEDSEAGKAGELVKVRPGFARNFLLPKGLAVVADVFNMKVFEAKKALIEEQAQKRKENAEAAKDKIGEDAVVSISAKAGESGKLFGAITKEKIAAAVSEEFSLALSKENITINEAIKALGQHKAKISLGSKIETEVTIKVEREE